MVYSEVPWNYLSFPHNRELLMLATGGLSGLVGWDHPPGQEQIASGLYLFIIVVLLTRHMRRHQNSFHKIDSNVGLSGTLILLLCWCALTAIILYFSPLGSLGSGLLEWVISGVIILFLPLSLAGGGLLAWVSGQLVPRRWVVPVTMLLIVVGSVWGATTMIDIVKPLTVLVRPADIRAMFWIRENTSPDAYFAINVWPWSLIPTRYAGTDGGYWISVLTNRRSILPSAFYNSGDLPANLLNTWAQTNSLDDPEIRAHLQAAGITHIYIGVRGGHLLPEHLLNRPFIQLIYHDEQVYIFTWKVDQNADHFSDGNQRATRLKTE
jgi:hypothetical protein